MINPFRRRNKARVETVLADVDAQFKKWDARFRQLEEAVESLNAKFPQVSIENVHIHQPVLEKLEFRLDGLDIEHLSGSLNLGNNFGAKPASENKSAQKPVQKDKSTTETGLHRTPSGFRLNNRR